MDWDSGVNRRKLLHLDWISDKTLMNSTELHLVTSDGAWSYVRKRMHMCMCDWDTLLYSRKWTEHCKPALPEKIKIIK